MVTLGDLSGNTSAGTPEVATSEEAPSLGIGVVSVATVASAIFGMGTASAINEYVGMTYDKGVVADQFVGGTATIATRTGEALQTGDCIVVGSRTASFLGSSGFSGKPGPAQSGLQPGAG